MHCVCHSCLCRRVCCLNASFGTIYSWKSHFRSIYALPVFQTSRDFSFQKRIMGSGPIILCGTMCNIVSSVLQNPRQLCGRAGPCTRLAVQGREDYFLSPASAAMLSALSLGTTTAALTIRPGWVTVILGSTSELPDWVTAAGRRCRVLVMLRAAGNSVVRHAISKSLTDLGTITAVSRETTIPTQQTACLHKHLSWSGNH